MSRLFGRLGGAIATAFVVSGCAGLPLEQGRSNVQSLVHSRAPVITRGCIGLADRNLARRATDAGAGAADCAAGQPRIEDALRAAWVDGRRCLRGGPSAESVPGAFVASADRGRGGQQGGRIAHGVVCGPSAARFPQAHRGGGVPGAAGADRLRHAGCARRNPTRLVRLRCRKPACSRSSIHRGGRAAGRRPGPAVQRSRKHQRARVAGAASRSQPGANRAG